MSETWIVTGAAGFIGANLVRRLLSEGGNVVGIDDLSRDGVAANAQMLESEFGLEISRLDISDADAVLRTFRQIDDVGVVVHLAGQVSMLTSVKEPRRDFEVNALGSLNILEAMRQYCPDAAFIGTSSNKVYGDLEWTDIHEYSSRYVAAGYESGFDETTPLDFSGPYGCSKGMLDQYAIDYGRTFGMRTASLRLSTVYGPLQRPREDQGWVTYLLGEAINQRPITLSGTGKQVRDILHVDDLVNLLIGIKHSMLPSVGYALNVGGGPANSLSILELFDFVTGKTGISSHLSFGKPRPADQKYYVSNLTQVSNLSGWSPQIDVSDGLSRLLEEI